MLLCRFFPILILEVGFSAVAEYLNLFFLFLPIHFLFLCICLASLLLFVLFSFLVAILSLLLIPLLVFLWIGLGSFFGLRWAWPAADPPCLGRHAFSLAVFGSVCVWCDVFVCCGVFCFDS